MRVASAAVLALVAAALAGGSPATAAAHRDGRTPPRAPTAPAGTISTVAGGVGGPGRATRVALAVGLSVQSCAGVAFGAGRLYIGALDTVREVTPGTDRLTTPAGMGNTDPLGDGGPAPKAGMDTCAVAVDHSGNLVLADLQHQRIRAVAAATGTFYGKAMTAGNIYTIAGNGTGGFSGDGGPATQAEISNPFGVAVDAAGNVLISDTFNQRIRMVAAKTGTFYGQAVIAGDIYTIAGNGRRGFSGDGGPATKAEFTGPQGLAVDTAGNLLITDEGNDRIRVVAATTGTFYGKAMTAGNIYTVVGTGTRGFSGDGGPATKAELRLPQAVAVDAAGNVVIADTINGRVRVVAAHTGTFYGKAMTAGDIYTVAGNGRFGFSGDGGPATKAELRLPEGVAVDAAGNLVIADQLNERVRVVAASTGTFYGKAMTAGDIYTVAGTGGVSFSGDGGPATSAEFSLPTKLALDGAGNLLIADTFDGRIRVAAAHTGTFYGKAMTAGHVYTVAGNGKFRFSGDGGPATSAALHEPAGVKVDAAGNLVIADRKTTGSGWSPPTPAPSTARR